MKRLALIAALLLAACEGPGNQWEPTYEWAEEACSVQYKSYGADAVCACVCSYMIPESVDGSMCPHADHTVSCECVGPDENAADVCIRRFWGDAQ